MDFKFSLEDLECYAALSSDGSHLVRYGNYIDEQGMIQLTSYIFLKRKVTALKLLKERVMSTYGNPYVGR